MTSYQKPKLLLFRPSFDEIASNNHHPQIIKMEKSYKHYFDVVVIDCKVYNYNELLDKYEPDICLFQSIGLKNNITNVASIYHNNDIPKLGLAIMDAASASRGSLVRLMESIGIHHIFFVGAIMGEVFTDAQHQILYYPHFIDPDINHDYGLGKTIPVLLTGNYQKEFYSWRYKIKKPVMDNFPALYFSHPGYKTTSEIPESLRIHGEKYFRLLSSSYVSLTCGSFKNALLMKHLEIPGARSCLVCDENNTVKAHGFSDMVNCIFSTPENIVEKLKYIFEHPEKLEEITKNGYEFVHNNHTYKQRSQILQWYKLNKQLKPGQKIIQPSLLGELEIVDKTSDRNTIHLKGSMDVKWITEVDELIAKGKYSEAEKMAIKVSAIAEYIHDSRLRLYLIHMLNGRKEYGFKILQTVIKHGSKLNLLPDPVNLSFFILHLLALSKKIEATEYACVGLEYRREELDFVRLIAFRLANENELYDQLSKVVSKNETTPRYKSFYYFYNYEFVLKDIIKKIAIKNIKGINKSFFRKELKQHDLPHNRSILIDRATFFSHERITKICDELDKEISIANKLKRKLQNQTNHILEKIL